MDAPPRERRARNHAEIERDKWDVGADDEEAEGNERSARNTMGPRTGSDPKPRVVVVRPTRLHGGWMEDNYAGDQIHVTTEISLN